MVGLFVDSLSNVEAWVPFAFVVISFSVFVNGGSYGNNVIIAGLSLIYLVPMALVNAVASANVALAPVAVIALFAFILALNRVFGQALWILAVFGAVAVMAGV